jgi:hypothetical protein
MRFAGMMGADPERVNKMREASLDEGPEVSPLPAA